MSASTTLLLSNLYSPEEFKENPEFVQELREDISEECMKFGEIVEINIEGGKDGRVRIKFQEEEGCKKAFNSLNGRHYAGKIIKADFGIED